MKHWLPVLSACSMIVSSPAHAQNYCASLDSEQIEINSLIRDLKRVYPLTYSFLKSCVRSAKNQDGVAGCMATAGAMAQCSYDDWRNTCGYSTIDFGTRLAAIAARQSELTERKRKFGYCNFQIAPDE